MFLIKKHSPSALTLSRFTPKPEATVTDPVVIIRVNPSRFISNTIRKILTTSGEVDLSVFSAGGPLGRGLVLLVVGS
jgi:hypothetical protein